LRRNCNPSTGCRRSRITSLARFAGAAKAQAVERLRDERRIATLLAYIRTLEASAHDDVLDLFDVIVTDMFADAKAAGHKERSDWVPSAISTPRL
jgi:hypothetical protein